MELYHLLVVLALFSANVKASLLHDSTSFKLEMYMRRNNMLLETLIRDGCPSVLNHKREVRAIKNPEVKLKAEIVTYERLSDELVACRAAIAEGSRPTMKTAKRASPTTTPTTEKSTPTTTTPTTTTPTTTTSFKALSTECFSAMNLTEAWRRDYNGSGIKPKNGQYNCDSSDMTKMGRPWFRFVGDAGTRLLNRCVSKFSCGTHVAFWSDAAMPSEIGVVSRVPIYGSWDSCKQEVYQISVLRCSNKHHDFVYRYEGQVDSCYRGFCGME